MVVLAWQLPDVCWWLLECVTIDGMISFLCASLCDPLQFVYGRAIVFVISSHVISR